MSDKNQCAAEGDGMLEPLIYAAIMHSGRPKTIGDFEQAAANVADMLKRRAQPQPKGTAPKLDDIEQYRMQMAGISTAALGYWKEGDDIHPDYDTVPLRDVAKLYAKYDALYKAAQTPAPVADSRVGLAAPAVGQDRRRHFPCAGTAQVTHKEHE